jgi:hypothetical protein
MELTDAQKVRIAELKAMKPGEFVLRDMEHVTQGDIESWADAMGGFDLTGDNMNLPRMRRLSFQAAYKIGWFNKAPKLEDADFPLMPPVLVSAIGDKVLEFYNAVTIPDASFT